MELLNEKKSLTNEEMMTFDLHNERVARLELQKNNILLEHRVSTMEVNQKLMEINGQLQQEKSKRSIFNDTIRENYEIESERFGYDPETGEIKENKPETK